MSGWDSWFELFLGRVDGKPTDGDCFCLSTTPSFGTMVDVVCVMEIAGPGMLLRFRASYFAMRCGTTVEGPSGRFLEALEGECA